MKRKERFELKAHSYKLVLKILGRLGFRVVRQRGSHIVLKGSHGGRVRTVVVPAHKEIAVGTLKGILYQAGLAAEEFQKLADES